MEGLEFQLTSGPFSFHVDKFTNEITSLPELYSTIIPSPTTGGIVIGVTVALGLAFVHNYMRPIQEPDFAAMRQRRYGVTPSE